eukprot:TRINITY_DN4105_c0_g1_i4.p1 TRINITY_DN4105_c0_g1~~TRINITY_DN4105_c0_g1_i4.p1  ORF type:complete len:128 (-),score=13.91 TRINITY_DN4105_c0_g1_i4:280-663(-)
MGGANTTVEEPKTVDPPEDHSLKTSISIDETLGQVLTLMTQEPQKLEYVTLISSFSPPSPLQPRYVDKQISLVDEKLIRDRTGDLEKSINDQVQVLGEEANEYLHTRCEELKNLVRTVDQSDAMVKR